MDIKQNRKNNLNNFIKNNYKSINEFCVKNNEDYSAIHRYLSGSLQIGNIVVKRFEDIFNLKRGEFDKPNAQYKLVQIPLFTSTGSFTSVDIFLDRKPNQFAYIDWMSFNEFGINKNLAIGITYDNDSMYPDIKDGWSILVDLSEKEIIDGEDYAILVNNKIQFRKIYFSVNSSKLVLKPNNPQFPEAILDIKDVVIIGKPIYILCGRVQ